MHVYEGTMQLVM